MFALFTLFLLIPVLSVVFHRGSFSLLLFLQYAMLRAQGEQIWIFPFQFFFIIMLKWFAKLILY
jgi:hypothetical protein